MNPWLETSAVILLLIVAAGVGYAFSRLPRYHWLWGYCIPLALLVLFNIASRHPAVLLAPPVSWIMMGRRKFALVGIIAVILLTTPLSRLPRRRLRVMVAILLGIYVLVESVMPFAAPIFNRRELAAMTTQIDREGICRQSAGYTCGPASAVTALRLLGLPAQEGDIAILSRTSIFAGTPPDVLAEALQSRYGDSGLHAECRAFRNISELKDAGLTLAVISYGPMTDHYVTVLEVTDAAVIVGDPLNGRQKLSYEEFEGKWRFIGVVLKRAGFPLKARHNMG
ncbi:MAG TPA: cysteine peptidase family C39 domain-containing protein [Tepidisphaeraceae bacterium]|jgi:predicted double-glycine peptidase|nr:cysteine peptidase family C39 domain-containing protein [Tepidisphaeraceae bacterium]